MSELAMNAAKMIDMLPETEKALAFEMLKRFVLAYDPDFTKCTAEEETALELAVAEYAAGEVVSDSDIDWN